MTRHNYRSPHQKTVLVTGGNRGIGKAICRLFSKEGFRVAACSGSGKGSHDLEADHTDYRFICDVSSPEQVRQGVGQLIETLGRIDVLVNNAGIAGSNSLGPESSDDLWHKILSVNLNGTYYMCKAVMPYLPEQKGRILNMGSVLSLKGAPDQSAYTAAKHGVLGLTRSLAVLLGPKGITVNCICPGWVKTDMALQRWQALGITEKEAARGNPMNRIVTPLEIAQTALFLASDAAQSITGQAIRVDGGL